jgi:amino acid efflux transporter
MEGSTSAGDGRGTRASRDESWEPGSVSACPRDSAGSTSPASTLRKVIRTRHAVALYVTSVIGPGILVLPGLAARIAGPGSIIAWAILAGASIPFALTFASLSARRPESGGVYAFAREAFGPRIATVAGWLFALWMVTGAPAVALIVASYLGYAFPLTRPETFVLGFAVVAAAFGVNLRGIVLSNQVQLVIAGTIVALLTVVILVSGVRVQAANFQPFLPNGLVPIGTAAALIFWAFLGYENVSNVAEEFENPQRDFRRSVFASVALVGGLYFAVAVVTIGTGSYSAGASVAPFAAILAGVIGHYGSIGTAVLAVFIIFGVVNAYTTGMSRVIYAAARDGAFPSALARIDPRTGVPNGALYALFGGASTVFLAYFLFDVGLGSALLVASGAAIVVYIVGSAAGVRIQHRAGRGARGAETLAGISLGISIAVLPFIGPLVLVAVGTIGVALVFGFVRTSRPSRLSPGS